MTYTIELSVNDDGFWLAKATFFDKVNLSQTRYGEVCATPGEAVTTLLQKAGIETVTGAMVIKEKAE